MDLSKLILLRNDPEVAAEFLEAAEGGDVDAQYGMGLIYAEGRGVEQDLARACMWLTIAVEAGDQDARLLRQRVIVQMSDSDHERSERLIVEQRLRLGGRRRRRRPKDEHLH